MEINSELATLEDTTKLLQNGSDTFWDVIHSYHELLNDLLTNYINIYLFYNNISNNNYVLKITITFKNKCYYIFYSDKEPNDAIDGFITNSNYELLTDPNNTIFYNDYNNNNNIDQYLIKNIDDIDKKYISQIRTYFLLHYSNYSTVDSNGHYSETNTDEYFKYFTLYSNIVNTKLYKIYYDNIRLDTIINSFIFNKFKEYIKNNNNIIIFNNLEYYFNINHNNNCFTIGSWKNYNIIHKIESNNSFNYMFRNNIYSDNNKKFNIIYHFVISESNINLVNYSENYYEINNNFKLLWNNIKVNNSIYNWIILFVKNICSSF